jgi:hypothetical protein
MNIQQATTEQKYSKLDGTAIFILLISPYFSYLFFGVLFLLFGFYLSNDN